MKDDWMTATQSKAAKTKHLRRDGKNCSCWFMTRTAAVVSAKILVVIVQIAVVVAVFGLKRMRTQKAAFQKTLPLQTKLDRLTKGDLRQIEDKYLVNQKYFV